MSKNTFNNFSLFLLAAAAIFICSQCSRYENRVHSQDLNAARVGSIPQNSTDRPGIVRGETPPFTIDANDLERSFLNLPPPHVYLVFPDKKSEGVGEASSDVSGQKVELPAEAVELVDSYWKAALNYRFKNEINKAPDAQTSRQAMLDLLRSSQRTIDNLQKINIQAPAGVRPISQEEAGEIIAFVASYNISASKQAQEKSR